MNITKNLWIIGVIVLMIVVVVVLVVRGTGAHSTEKSTKTIKIGAIVSLSGAASTNGEDIKKGMDLAQSDLAKQGINVEIDYQDDATNPKDSVSAAQKMLATDKPDVFVGPIWSFLIDAANPIESQAKIVTYSPCSTSEYINSKSDYLFNGYIKNSLKELPATEWLKSMNAKKVAIIASQDSWGDSHMEAYSQAVTDANATLVLTERVPFGSEMNSLPTILLKAKSAGADAILWTGYDDGAAVFLKKMHELGLNIPVLGTDAFKTVISNGNVHLTAQDKIYVFDTERSNEFDAKFSKAYGVTPGECANTAYDGVMIIADAVQNSKDGNIQDYMRNNVNYSGYAHTYKFDQNGDIKGGQWIVRELK